MQTTHSKHISSSLELELEPLGDELELGPRGDPPLAIAENIPCLLLVLRVPAAHDTKLFCQRQPKSMGTCRNNEIGSQRLARNVASQDF